MTTIKPFPELVALAARQAEDVHDQVYCVFTEDGLYSTKWDDVIPLVKDARIRAHLALLRDLTRPASYDAVARLAAARLRVPARAVHQAVEDACGAAWPLLPAALRGVLDTTFDNPACLAAVVAWLWRNEG